MVDSPGRINEISGMKKLPVMKRELQPELLTKLPAITAAFWVMKITATTLGETGGDWLSMTMKVGYLVSTILFFALFLAAVGSQLAAKAHYPFLYEYPLPKSRALLLGHDPILKYLRNRARRFFGG